MKKLQGADCDLIKGTEWKLEMDQVHMPKTPMTMQIADYLLLIHWICSSVAEQNVIML